MIKAVFPIFALIVSIFYVLTIDVSDDSHAVTECLTINESVARLEEKGIFDSTKARNERVRKSEKQNKICPRLVLKDASVTSTCQEEDNVKSGLFVEDYKSKSARNQYTSFDPSSYASVTGFRLKAFHPIAPPAFHHFGANFSNCGPMTTEIFMKIGEYGKGPGQYNSEIPKTPGLRNYNYYASMNGLKNPCSPHNASSSFFPDSMQYGKLDNLTVHFTSWTNSDQRGLYGAKGSAVNISIASSDEEAVLGMYFFNSSSTVYPILLGDCRLKKSKELQVCETEIPDLYKPEGCYTSAIQLLLRPTSKKSKPTIYFDSLGAKSRENRPQEIRPLSRDKKRVVDTVYDDFWFRYPHLLNVSLGSDSGMSDRGSMVTFALNRRTYYIDQLVETFVMYEDGNIRLAPYPKRKWLQIPFGASFIFGQKANYTDARPVEPVQHIKIIEFTPRGFKAEIRYHPDPLRKEEFDPQASDTSQKAQEYRVMVELSSSEEVTEMTFTGIQDWAVPGAALGVFRSMTVTKPPVYPALNDIDTALAYDKQSKSLSGHFTFPAPGQSITGDTISFVRLCPSYHNSDGPEFSAELLCE